MYNEVWTDLVCQATLGLRVIAHTIPVNFLIKFEPIKNVLVNILFICKLYEVFPFFGKKQLLKASTTMKIPGFSS